MWRHCLKVFFPFEIESHLILQLSFQINDLKCQVTREKQNKNSQQWNFRHLWRGLNNQLIVVLSHFISISSFVCLFLSELKKNTSTDSQICGLAQQQQQQKIVNVFAIVIVEMTAIDLCTKTHKNIIDYTIFVL